MSDYTALLLAIFLLVANAFFVGAEFALISARRSQIEPRAAAGSRVARTTLRAMEQVSLVMAGAQLGITVCSLGLGAVGEPAVAHLMEPLFAALGVPDHLVHPVAFMIALTLVVYLHVVLGEMVPKNIAIAGPERSALLLGPPMMVVVTIIKPLVVALNATANGILRLLRVEPRDEIASAYTREEVEAMVDESRQEGTLADEEYERLAGALGFTGRQVADVALPVETLQSVHRGARVMDLEAACAATGYSRFPVVGDDDELVGYLHIKDALEVDPERRTRTIDDKWVRPFANIRPVDTLSEALQTLRAKGAHMGRVVEADGQVRGLVMLEDVLEELVGEIRDATRADAPSDDPSGAPLP
ncbi:hemolysin family protein [Nocardioides massiliensis]|uniref:CBS domain containing-hemolysin-like protein n=1 Tax=Nocardioides massiliensis TaxID=1325935 RepID=A0ABT9NQA1_9ACTN|nr:hemolysin family protein [Nocardioides massiliensis]MDP9822481.1 CBS domain containing-hemolysin-like protein [Nocardioides massiliensis]